MSPDSPHPPAGAPTGPTPPSGPAPHPPGSAPAPGSGGGGSNPDLGTPIPPAHPPRKEKEEGEAA